MPRASHDPSVGVPASAAQSATTKKPRHLRRGPVWEERARRALGRTCSGGNSLLDLVRLAQHVAAAPHGLDEVAAFGGVGEILAQLADEDVDDLQFRLLHAALERVEDNFL